MTYTMSDYLKENQFLRQILGIQKDYYANVDINAYIIKDSYINEFSAIEHSVKVIFDQVNFKFSHVSDNVEALSGYSKQDLYEFKMPLVLKIFNLEHYNFIYIFMKWAFSVYEKKREAPFNIKYTLCGVKIKHKNGTTMRLLIRYYPLEVNEGGLPIVAAIVIDDITHIMKADFFWGRIEYGKEERKVNHINSKEEIDRPFDIITNREKSILPLLIQGKESKEIGEELFLSVHTVDHHRRNMLSKMGVKDTTGLIQICKMAGII
jgi:DNA-binding CsgD family transcriptional regulator